MPERLSPLAAMFLEFEQADESAHMHIGAVSVFDPVPGGRNPTLGDLCERLTVRLASVRRFRQRLSSARTGGVSWHGSTRQATVLPDLRLAGASSAIPPVTGQEDAVGGLTAELIPRAEEAADVSAVAVLPPPLLAAVLPHPDDHQKTPPAA
jgi:hypothetical protein